MSFFSGGFEGDPEKVCGVLRYQTSSHVTRVILCPYIVNYGIGGNPAHVFGYFR